MKEQNYSNHTRYVPTYHFFLYTVALIAMIASCISLYESIGGTGDIFIPGILVLICICVFGLLWYARSFALRAHDKAIRAEENLRHYVLTGKLLDRSLRMGQITALRFASDEELPELARKAAAEKLSGKEIKQQIKNWKPDYNRV